MFNITIERINNGYILSWDSEIDDGVFERQKETKTKLEEGIEENTAKAELIYQKYQEIEKMLNGLKEARKKKSWKEIQEELKDNKKVKKINPKDSKIVVDL